ncbi:hypothetical protein LCGC14_1143440 [marine sediment metagenome]|uniref:Uncharacterized protein n=1 Tax=marine sediment metagenome TaxID=412755 RepID=A0A0F9MKM3_9ZZZZ
MKYKWVKDSPNKRLACQHGLIVAIVQEHGNGEYTWIVGWQGAYGCIDRGQEETKEQAMKKAEEALNYMTQSLKDTLK